MKYLTLSNLTENMAYARSLPNNHSVIRRGVIGYWIPIIRCSKTPLAIFF